MAGIGRDARKPGSPLTQLSQQDQVSGAAEAAPFCRGWDAVRPATPGRMAGEMRWWPSRSLSGLPDERTPARRAITPVDTSAYPAKPHRGLAGPPKLPRKTRPETKFCI